MWQGEGHWHLMTPDALYHEGYNHRIDIVISPSHSSNAFSHVAWHEKKKTPKKTCEVFLSVDGHSFLRLMNNNCRTYSWKGAGKKRSWGKKAAGPTQNPNGYTDWDAYVMLGRTFGVETISGNFTVRNKELDQLTKGDERSSDPKKKCGTKKRGTNFQKGDKRSNPLGYCVCTQCLWQFSLGFLVTLNLLKTGWLVDWGFNLGKGVFNSVFAYVWDPLVYFLLLHGFPKIGSKSTLTRMMGLLKMNEWRTHYKQTLSFACLDEKICHNLSSHEFITAFWSKASTSIWCPQQWLNLGAECSWGSTLNIQSKCVSKLLCGKTNCGITAATLENFYFSSSSLVMLSRSLLGYCMGRTVMTSLLIYRSFSIN